MKLHEYDVTCLETRRVSYLVVAQTEDEARMKAINHHIEDEVDSSTLSTTIETVEVLDDD